MDSPRITEEIGPDEDLQLKSPRQKVFGDECPEVRTYRGVLNVERTDPVIEKFLKDVPYLMQQQETIGLIWNKKLQSENFKYEKGFHFVSTREADKATTHATVSFYRDGATGETFAIKTLQKSTDFHPEEIIVGLTIQHPNICSVYGIIIQAGLVHILLEHAGLPLYDERAWIADNPKQMQHFAKQCFHALEVIHNHGYVHCDIKPDNIMIQKQGNEFTVKLIDFGTCNKKDTSLPTTARTTLFYWSPEMWQAYTNKNVIICKPAMDVYALALTLYFVHTSGHLTQRFKKKDLKNLMIQSPENILLIALPETLQPDLSSLMRSCLDENQENRISAHEALKHLTAEDVLTRLATSHTKEGNYKESFNTLCCTFNKTVRAEKSNTLFKFPTLSQNVFSQKIQEKGTVTFGSINTEKRELKILSKGRKSGVFSNTKFNKPHKNKKSCRLQTKMSRQKMSQLMPDTFHTSLVSPDVDLEKRIEIKSDETSYSCSASALLKNLALHHIMEPQQMQTPYFKGFNRSGGVSCVIGGATNKTQGKAMEVGSVSKTLTINQPVDRSFKFSGDKPGTDIQSRWKCKKVEDVRITQDDKNVELSTIDCDSPVEVPSHTGLIIKEGEHNTDCHSDDMDFVFSAFDDNAFNGTANDVTDHMFALLQKSEPESSSLDVDINTLQVPTVSPFRTAQTQEKPMDTDLNESASAAIAKLRSNLNLPTGKVNNRKRIAESALSPCVLGKTGFFPDIPHDSSINQLPNFDKILP